MDRALLELEANPNDIECVNRAFRTIHTLKGSGATAGFTELANLLHGAEDVFNGAREKRFGISPAMIDISLKLSDLVHQLIAGASGTASEAVDQGEELIRNLKALATTALESAPDGTDRPLLELWSLRFKPSPQVFQDGYELLDVMRMVLSTGYGAVRADPRQLSAVDDFDPECCYLSWELQVLTDKGSQALRSAFAFVESGAVLSIERTDAEAAWVLPPRAYFESSVLKDFRDEAQDNLIELENQALKLTERGVEGTSLEGIMRVLHNLKGLSGLLLSDVRFAPPPRHPVRAMRELCHEAESVLQTAKARAEQGLEAPPTDLMLEVADWLKDLLRAFDDAREAWPQELLGRLARERTERAEGSAQKLGSHDFTARTISLPPAKPTAEVTAPPVARQANAVPQTETQRSVRVDQSKLERLMRAVGELLVANNSLPVLAERAATGDAPALAKEIKETGIQFAHIADDLRDSIRQIQMMPARGLFQRFPRMIRDLSRTQNKKVQLIISGEETEVDRTILERITDPLVHLIRNAVDHGLEPPEERLALGKSELGTVGLEVLNEGNYVVLRISDDGRGIDPERLRTKAVERGLITQTAADALTPEQSLELVLLPGFSTAEKVTDISGRGVGMDVVHTNIRQLRGTLHIASEVGCGTTFSIRLPASLVVSRGVLFDCGSERLVFPSDGVREMVKIRNDQIHEFSETATVSVRGTVYPVYWLAPLLGFDRDGKAGHAATLVGEEQNAVIVATRSA
jgi:two-component system chemotaxis sensor kinase CheA